MDKPNYHSNTVYLVRHAEGIDNVERTFSYKKFDRPLSTRGVLQAQQTAAYFELLPIAAVYASPLLRAQETAQHIAQAAGDLPVVIVEEFREINMGDLEGQPVYGETWEAFVQVLRAWHTGSPDQSYPNGENYPMLLDRMRRGLQTALQGREKQHIVIVGHGGIFTNTLNAICQNVDLLEIFKKENLNCSVTELEMEDGATPGRLVRWADTGHLHGPAADFVDPTPRNHET